MLRTIVDSTTMRSVGYQAKGRVLEIEFNSRDVYQYFGVPKSIYRQLLGADSKGHYFNLEIRDSYPYVEVRQTRAAG